MQKNSIRFVMMSVVAAVLATGCASSKGAEAGAGTETGGTTAMSGGRQTAEHNVSSTNWAMVDSGPLSLVGVTGVGNFNGEAACYATTSATCSNAATTGTAVYSCTGGTCSAQNGGQVASGQTLCCGAAKGAGGKLRVIYTK